ncbi:MAG: MaoC/PaaZ C-terminal domain-containing protein [Fimbriiglobus sp.]
MSFTPVHLYFDDLDTTTEWLSPGRTVTESDIMTYAGFSGDFNPMHIDEEYAKTTPFRRRIAHGFGVFSLASGLGLQAPMVRTIALSGVRYWKFLQPVYIGDTIRVKTRVVEKTLKGRGKRGEVIWLRIIMNQDGKVVQEGEILTLVECKPLVRPDEAPSEASA